MNRLCSLLLSLAIAPLLPAADWTKIASTNFDLLTNAGEYNGRETLTLFENARAFFVREQPFLVDTLPRVTIVNFNDVREYRSYRPHDAALAYSLRRDLGDFIVTSYLEDGESRIALHEYAHLVISHSGLSVPLWLNEGLAEVYSTLQEVDGKLRMGQLHKDRTVSLGSENWMRLPILIRADHNSREYNEANRVGIFYAESALLAHMLMLGDGFRDRFPRFLDRVSLTGSTETAFREIYGKSTADIEFALRAHFREMIQGDAAYPARPAAVEIGPARLADEAEVGATKAILTACLGRVAEARTRLERLGAEYPANPAVEAARANVDAQSGDNEAAISRFRSAIEHGAAGWSAHWGYALLLDNAAGDMPARLQALTAALQRNPSLVEARLRLARNLTMAGRFSEALAQLDPAARPGPAYACRWNLQLAQIALAANGAAAARPHLEQARAAVRTPQQKEAVDRLAVLIEQGLAAPSAAPPETPDTGRPTLRRNPPPDQKKQ